MHVRCHPFTSMTPPPAKEARGLICFQLADFIFGVGCSEVEVDQLTGETKVLRVDILYDAGKPLNPAVDLGQIEGAFVMGIGMVLREQVIRGDADAEAKAADGMHTSGVLWNNGTWEYKLPCSQDVPVDMRVSYLADSRHPRLVLSSKATGEPPLVLACSVAMAVRDAIASTRASDSEFFQMPTPVMVNDIATLMKL